MCGISGEDEYWERRREELEKPKAWDENEPVYEDGNLFLDEEIEEGLCRIYAREMKDVF